MPYNYASYMACTEYLSQEEGGYRPNSFVTRPQCQRVQGSNNFNNFNNNNDFYFYDNGFTPLPYNWNENNFNNNFNNGYNPYGPGPSDPWGPNGPLIQNGNN